MNNWTEKKLVIMMEKRMMAPSMEKKCLQSTMKKLIDFEMASLMMDKRKENYSEKWKEKEIEALEIMKKNKMV
jgi:hypothetical protein